MEDTYQDFKSLSEVEKEGRDFKIWVKKTKSKIAVIAPHGGAIELGTSEIAKSVAGDDFTCYSFEGIKNKENKKYLHITSTNFDEPECIEICNASDMVLAIHGAEDDDKVVYVGGRNEYLKQKMIEKLKKAGFSVRKDTTNHSGRNAENICNKCTSMQGLQLEISNGLRKKMFKGLKRNHRNPTNNLFNEFVKSIRGVLCEYVAKSLV
ncbi:MAG: hypothetical protein SRB2_00004 [Desulfobacteraceae bacterium Eth-SRB2]|nr:MAG: hypothetical protein SRB2_00004 [Desulfobacteraceae bacterium Eth-SRB2]